MQLSIKLTLWALGFGILALVLMTAYAEAQSLSPMQHQGTTPSDIKGFRLSVGNPYRERMHFDLIAMDPGFTQRVDGVSVSPPDLIMAPGVRRTVILAFKIDAPQRERTIGLCVVPRISEGPVQPRVCGTYTGTVLAR